MAKQPIGFVHFPDPRETDAEIKPVINDIEQEFKAILSELGKSMRIWRKSMLL